MKRGKAKGGCLVVCSGGLDSTVAKLRQFNFNQWVRFQEYAETHL